MISDNGPSFRNKQIEKMCAKFKVRRHFSTGYNPAANGQAEAFNKVLCKLLKKVVSQNKRHWHEKLLESLWALEVNSYVYLTNYLNDVSPHAYIGLSL